MRLRQNLLVPWQKSLISFSYLVNIDEVIDWSLSDLDSSFFVESNWVVVVVGFSLVAVWIVVVVAVGSVNANAKGHDVHSIHMHDATK